MEIDALLAYIANVYPSRGVIFKCTYIDICIHISVQLIFAHLQDDVMHGSCMCQGDSCTRERCYILISY